MDGLAGQVRVGVRDNSLAELVSLDGLKGKCQLLTWMVE